MPCLLLVVICLFGSLVVRDRRDAIMHAPLDLPPDALAAKAREIAASFGYSKKPADSAFRLEGRGAFLNHLKSLPEPRKWDEWLASEAPIAFDYRDSPSPLVAQPDGEVTPVNPPPIVPGMVYARLDGYARLLEFRGVPYQLADDLKEPVQPESVFRACGLDMAAFTETVPQELPSSAADTVRAWKGPHPKIPKTELTVEIASWKGRITRARVAPPWAAPNPHPQANASLLSKIGEIYPMVVVVVGLCFAAMFARRNWKLQRVDRNGALRVAFARFLLGLVAWVGSVHAVPTDDMAGLFYRGIADWLISAALLWLLYLALEPAVRSRWPHSIVTWNRVLAGRWRDAQVGSHILIGATAGCVIWLAFNFSGNFTDPKGTLHVFGGLFSASGTRQWIGANASTLAGALQTGLAFIFALFVLRTLVRKDWLAATVASLLGIFQEGQVIRSAEWTTALVYFVVYAIIFFVLLRFGLVASISAVYFINSFGALILGLDWKAWYAPYGLATLLLLLTIALVAFWRSLGSHGLLGEKAAESL